MLDGTVLPPRVHALENEQNSPTILGIKFVLQLSQARNTLLQSLFRTFFCMPAIGISGVVILQSEVFAVLNPIKFCQLFVLHFRLTCVFERCRNPLREFTRRSKTALERQEIQVRRVEFGREAKPGSKQNQVVMGATNSNPKQ